MRGFGNTSPGTTGLAMLACACAVLLPACSSGPAFYDDPSAIAVLDATQNNPVHGVVTFVRVKDKDLAQVNVNMAGFRPSTAHGLHIHEYGDCTARDAASAGAHFNPGAADHGGPDGGPLHAGDLGNVVADDRGNVYASLKVPGIAFGSGGDSIVGRAIVVHAVADGYKTRPAGNSGARLACGTITRNADRRAYSPS
ncbi:MAG TPA: superoxide dismutase family protein [Burkholderiales bacterium]|nr:superoxide dismutase family protein [Burkholderiales bacterium]